MIPIIAIDPGKLGGIAVLTADGNITAWPMPKTPGDLYDLILEIKAGSPNLHAVIEQVGGFGAGSGNAMFNFGEGYGFAQGVLTALGIPLQRVRPQRWQKDLCVGARGDLTPSGWKNKLKAEAQRRYPNAERITLGTADALLILAWMNQRVNNIY